MRGSAASFSLAKVSITWRGTANLDDNIATNTNGKTNREKSSIHEPAAKGRLLIILWI